MSNENKKGTLSFSPMNADCKMCRCWYHWSPLANNNPFPMKFLTPCCCIHDLPDTMLCFFKNVSTISKSVKHNLGSVPFQNTNLFPESKSINKINIFLQLTDQIRKKIEARTVDFRPEGVMREETSDNIMINETHITSCRFRNKFRHFR